MSYRKCNKAAVKLAQCTDALIDASHWLWEEMLRRDAKWETCIKIVEKKLGDSHWSKSVLAGLLAAYPNLRKHAIGLSSTVEAVPLSAASRELAKELLQAEADLDSPDVELPDGSQDERLLACLQRRLQTFRHRRASIVQLREDELPSVEALSGALSSFLDWREFLHKDIATMVDFVPGLLKFPEELRAQVASYWKRMSKDQVNKKEGEGEGGEEAATLPAEKTKVHMLECPDLERLKKPFSTEELNEVRREDSEKLEEAHKVEKEALLSFNVRKVLREYVRMSFEKTGQEPQQMEAIRTSLQKRFRELQGDRYDADEMQSWTKELVAEYQEEQKSSTPGPSQAGAKKESMELAALQWECGRLHMASLAAKAQSAKVLTKLLKRIKSVDQDEAQHERALRASKRRKRAPRAFGR